MPKHLKLHVIAIGDLSKFHIAERILLLKNENFVQNILQYNSTAFQTFNALELEAPVYRNM